MLFTNAVKPEDLKPTATTTDKDKLSEAAVLPLRALTADRIGSLVCVRGIITKVTDVKPQLQVATYTCDECGFEIYQEITGGQYMPITECPATVCRTRKVNGSLFQLKTSDSGRRARTTTSCSPGSREPAPA